jgi:hypothetical protein
MKLDDRKQNAHSDDSGLVVYAEVEEFDAETLLNDALKPPRYDPLEFCNHIQAQVGTVGGISSSCKRS